MTEINSKTIDNECDKIYAICTNPLSIAQTAFDVIEDIVEYANKRGFDIWMDQFPCREIFTRRISWSIPSKKAIRRISDVIPKTNTILSLGSGQGFWELIMKLSHINVIATDPKDYDPSNPPFTPILKLNATDAVIAYPSCDALFINWPTYQASWAADALTIFTGSTVIYIGEDCTADDKFREIIDKNWNQEQYPLDNWQGIHDKLFICHRKTTISYDSD